MHSTSNLKDGYLGSGTHLRHAIRKYGVDNFKIEILEWCDTRDKLIEREKEIIAENHVNNPNCYNLKFGGLGGGKFINKEHQFKCSQAAGLKHSEKLKTDEEYRKKRSTQTSESNKRRHQRGDINPIQENYSWEGKKHKPETIDKIKLSKKGQGIGETNSQYGSQWINDGKQNKKIKMMGIVPTGWKLGRINLKPL